MDKVYKIYCIENTTNGRKYIGSSSRHEKRIGQHFIDLKGGYHHNEHLYADFLLHGENKFIHYILDECEESERYIKEGFYIENLKSHISCGGYNLDGIVEGVVVKSGSSIEKIKNAHIKFWENNLDARYSAILSQKSATAVLIVDLINGGISFYPSILSCGRETPIKYIPASVSRAVINFPYVVNCGKENAFGAIAYKDFTDVYNSDIEMVIKLLEENNKTRTRVNKKTLKSPTINKYQIIKYDKNMNFIKIFETASDAGRELNVHSDNIRQVAKYIRNYAGGFIYRYKNKELDEFYKNKNLPKRKSKRDSKACRKVVDIITGEVWNDILEASLCNNVGYSALKAKLSGQNKNDSNLRYKDEKG